MSEPPHGTLIVLNGTSSSGKTSVVKAFQDLVSEPYLETGIDKFIFMLPRRYLNAPLWKDVFGSATYAGATGKRLISGMHQATLALLQTGNNVLLDHVLIEREWVSECARLFAPERAYFIGVDCPLAVLEQRERDRADRTLGQAAAQFPVVHAYTQYDVRVDSSQHDPHACAQIILQHMEQNQPHAFQSLRSLGATESTP